MVVDVGSQFVNVVPVVDGFVLRKGTAASRCMTLCANQGTGLQRSNLPVLTRLNATGFLGPSNRRPYPVPLVPHQLIANKTPVDPEQPPNFSYRADRLPLTSQSWRTWATEREKDEWIATVGAVLENGWGDHQ